MQWGRESFFEKMTRKFKSEANRGNSIEKHPNKEQSTYK